MLDRKQSSELLELRLSLYYFTVDTLFPIRQCTAHPIPTSLITVFNTLEYKENKKGLFDAIMLTLQDLYSKSTTFRRGTLYIEVKGT